MSASELLLLISSFGVHCEIIRKLSAIKSIKTKNHITANSVIMHYSYSYHTLALPYFMRYVIS